MAGKPIKFTVVGDTKDFEQSMGKVDTSLEKAGTTAKAAGTKIDTAMSRAGDGADGVASKGAQAAGALTGLGDLIGGKFGAALTVGGTAMQGFADAGDLVNVVMESAIVKKVRDIAVLIAHRTAVIAASVASKAWAAAQWLVNAAMSANPIGLIIAAIVLLVAGIILLWKKSETFRTIVLAVWAAVQKAVKVVVDWILNTAWPFLKKIFAAIGQINQTLLATVKRVWNAVKAFIVGVVTSLYRTNASLWAKIYGTISSIWNRIRSVVSSAVSRVRSYVSSGFSSAYSSVRSYVGRIYSYVSSKVDSVVSKFRGIGGRIRGAVRGAFDGITSAFRSAINRVVSMWNRLHFRIPSITIPGIGTIGGGTIYVPQIPYLASGGIVTGPTLAMVGEAGAEAVIPLDQLGGLGGNTYHITVNVPVGASLENAGRDITRAIDAYESSGGRRRK